MAMRFLLGGSDMGTSVVRLGQIPGFIGNAEMGEAGICGLPFDDPTGSLVITGWQTFTVDESAGPAGQQRLWTCFIADRQYARATGTSLITGLERRIETTLVYLRRKDKAKAMEAVRTLSWGGAAHFVFPPSEEAARK